VCEQLAHTVLYNVQCIVQPTAQHAVQHVHNKSKHSAAWAYLSHVVYTSVSREIRPMLLLARRRTHETLSQQRKATQRWIVLAE